jgi:chromosome segregation ATPase
VNHQKVDGVVETKPNETVALDEMLRSVWDRTKQATELIESLRNENRELQSRVRNLEGDVSSLRGDVASRELDLRKTRAELTQVLNASGTHMFSPEEREMIKAKIRELISKINSYL